LISKYIYTDIFTHFAELLCTDVILLHYAAYKLDTYQILTGHISNINWTHIKYKLETYQTINCKQLHIVLHKHFFNKQQIYFVKIN